MHAAVRIWLHETSPGLQQFFNCQSTSNLVNCSYNPRGSSCSPSLPPTHTHYLFNLHIGISQSVCLVNCIYLFNLHIGIGLLALPKAFSEAGMVLGSILLIILAFVGYMTATYMIEAMAAANAYVKLEQREKKESSENESSSDAQKVNQVHVRIYSSNQ